MHKCLRCGKVCETAIFCDICQSVLLQRSRQDERALFSAPVPQVQVTELSSRQPISTVQDRLIRVRETSFVPVTKETQDLPKDDQELELALAERQSGGRWLQAPQTDLTPVSLSLPITRGIPARPARLGHLRRALVIVTLFAVMALVVDCILVSLVFTRQKSNESVTQPMLTFTPDVVYPGQLAHLQLRNFSPLAHVLLRRNVDEPVRLDSVNSLLQVNAQGSADTHVLVEDSWGTGNHYIEAEDIDDHYVASVAVQVIGSSPARPPHLQLSQQTLDLGADWQGANTLQPLTLQNPGGGRVTWTAWSNQPWLMLTPAQGTFSESQRIVIAVCRDHLRPGRYEGKVTFVSNTGANISLRVAMTVLLAHTDARAILVLTPPVLSFVATDSGSDPQEQVLTVSNPGARPLYWSFDHSAPTVSVDQELPLVEKMNWLEIEPRSGTLDPGKTVLIHLRVNSHNLLPSTYSGILTFNGGQNALNNPQPVALSLVVTPRCGIVANTGALSFTTGVGQQAPGQTLVLSMDSACSGSLSWHVSSLANWLSMTPTSGRVSAQNSVLSTVQVKSANLAPGTYDSFLVFLSEQRTQTVAVHLTVLASGQSPPEGLTHTGNVPVINTVTNGDDHNASKSSRTDSESTAPALALSSLNMTFRMTQGDANPPDQSVSVANTGGGLLYWQARADAASQSWLKVSPTTGTLSATQTGTFMLSVDGSSLEPGAYRSSVIVSATDGAGVSTGGSPQVLVVTLNVVQPCTLSISPTSLSFTASLSLLGEEPAEQSITLQGVGNCSRPILWQASVDSNSQSWIHLSATTGSDTGNSSVISVRVSTNDTLLGSHRGQITFSASDSSGLSLRNSSQVVNVTLFVLG